MCHMKICNCACFRALVAKLVTSPCVGVEVPKNKCLQIDLL